MEAPTAQHPTGVYAFKGLFALFVDWCHHPGQAKAGWQPGGKYT